MDEVTDYWYILCLESVLSLFYIFKYHMLAEFRNFLFCTCVVCGFHTVLGINKFFFLTWH